MLNNIFQQQNISSPFRNLLTLFGEKKINLQSASQSINDHLAKISKVIDSSMDQGMKKVDKIIVDSGELINTPVKWMKDMQRTWFIYIICLAIVCLCLLFFYCVCKVYFSRRCSGISRLSKRLTEITVIMAKNNNSNLSKY
jgi:hypothetical protein